MNERGWTGCGPTRTPSATLSPSYLLNGGDLLSLQRNLGHATLDMVRRYVNLDVGDIKRQHEAASPLDRLATTSATFARG